MSCPKARPIWSAVHGLQGDERAGGGDRDRGVDDDTATIRHQDSLLLRRLERESAGQGEDSALEVAGEWLIGKVHDVDLDLAGTDRNTKFGPRDDAWHPVGDETVDQLGL